MPGITLVGLGPGDPSALGPAARDTLATGLIYLRTRRHPVVTRHPALAQRPALEDHLRGDEPLAAALESWVDTLVDAAGRQPVVYAVPGNALVGDATVSAIVARAEGAGISVTTLAGGAQLDAVAPVLPPGALSSGLQLVDALELALATERAPFAGGAAALSPLRPLLVIHPAPGRVLDAACQALTRLYPSATAAQVIARGGESELTSRATTLADPDGGVADAIAIYVGPVSALRSGRSAAALQRIVARLRAPGGCPWDREQTHRSLMQAGIEEAYEVLEAIEEEDPTALREELGDLLLQVYLHAQIAEEAGEFTLEDVLGDLSAKLVRRHPHVFGDAHAASASDVVQHWDRIKRAERAERGVDEQERPLGQIPAALPALMRAQTVLRRAVRAGRLPLDPDALRARWRALAAGEATADAETLADALLAVTLVAAEAGLDAEQVLRERTRQIEAQARQRAVVIHDDLH